MVKLQTGAQGVYRLMVCEGQSPESVYFQDR